LHFLRQGRGAPPLVFVHGFGCTHEDWKLQTTHFAKSNEVVACDLRGHGQTPGRPEECSIEHYGGDVAALVTNLELKNVVLIGHSMGCRVVLEAARHLQKSVSGLVLVDGSRLADRDPEGAAQAARAVIDKAGYPAFAENLFRQMFFSPSAQATEMVARGVRSTAVFGADLWTRMARWDAGTMDAAFAAVKVPVLAIQSTTRNAQLVRSPLKAGETSPWVDYLKSKGARVEIVPAGHFTMLEEPAAVNRLIAEAGR
jgi:pimeloyl-ACP methyl ester carboxylesterase